MFALSKGSLTWPITDRNNEFASGGEDNPTTKFHGSALATREIAVIKPNSYGPEGWLVNVKWTWFWGASAYTYVGDPSDSHSRSQMFTQKTLTTTQKNHLNMKGAARGLPWFIHGLSIISSSFTSSFEHRRVAINWGGFDDGRDPGPFCSSLPGACLHRHICAFLVQSWCFKPKSWKDSGNMSSIKFIKILLESH